MRFGVEEGLSGEADLDGKEAGNFSAPFLPDGKDPTLEEGFGIKSGLVERSRGACRASGRQLLDLHQPVLTEGVEPEIGWGERGAQGVS